VAIDQIQIDHFQPGDQYNVKLGIVTYDQKSPAANKNKTETDGKNAESDG
jgi:hypothetical protein